MKILLNKEQVDYIFKIKGELDINPEKRYISIEFFLYICITQTKDLFIYIKFLNNGKV